MNLRVLNWNRYYIIAWLVNFFSNTCSTRLEIKSEGSLMTTRNSLLSVEIYFVDFWLVESVEIFCLSVKLWISFNVMTRHWLRYSLKSFEWQKCKMIYWWATNYFFNALQRFDRNNCKTDPNECLLESNDGNLTYRLKSCGVDLLSDHRTTIRVPLEPWYRIRFDLWP